MCGTPASARFLSSSRAACGWRKTSFSAAPKPDGSARSRRKSLKPPSCIRIAGPTCFCDSDQLFNAAPAPLWYTVYFPQKSRLYTAHIYGMIAFRRMLLFKGLLCLPGSWQEEMGNPPIPPPAGYPARCFYWNACMCACYRSQQEGVACRSLGVVARCWQEGGVTTPSFRRFSLLHPRSSIRDPWEKVSQLTFFSDWSWKKCSKFIWLMSYRKSKHHLKFSENNNLWRNLTEVISILN